MAKNQGERIEELAQALQELVGRHDRLAAFVEVQIGYLVKGQEDLQASLKETARDQREKALEHTAGLARVDQRCTSLEKQGDRNWQAWLALLGSGLEPVMNPLQVLRL